MCEYIIKHYWSKKTHSATLEPNWLSSGEKLTREQRKIKELYLQTIASSTYYNRLAQSKISGEAIGDYNIKYTYISKDDPLNLESKSRQVTDITMCITKKKSWVSLMVYGIAAGIIFLILYFFFFQPPDKKLKIQSPISKDTNKTNTQIVNSKPENKKVSESQELKNIICSYSDLNVDLPDKECWQYYVYVRCRSKIDKSYEEWLKESEEPECTSVTEFEIDELPNKLLGDKDIKKKIKKFFTGERENENN